MNFHELIRLRQSTRKYNDKPVEREKILHCIEAARLAPSACNSQPWSFIIIDEPQQRNKVARETYNNVIPFNKFVAEASAIVAVIIEKPTLISQLGGRIKNKDFYLIDIGIAAEHFCLQAAEEGLGTCMLGWFNEKNIQDILNIPKNKRIGLLITMGYSNVKIRSKIRKPLEKITKYNSYE
ncbi:MAG: nitroreductase family protein [Bacteroidales bacterium]|jgi:nitroreductase|nr:nitroreductase family protein [Bacteroidales bacterium]MDD4213241.1 nitroreductase family protein [Bacteroidales bacterium]